MPIEYPDHQNLRPLRQMLAGEFIKDGLVVGYKFTDNTGTTLTDIGPHHLHGTLTNGPTWTGSRGITFDGSDDKIVVATPNSPLRLTGALSMEAHFRYTSGNCGIMDKTGEGATNFNYQLFVEGAVKSRLIKATGINDHVSGLTPTSTANYHVVATWDGRERRLYINGFCEYTRAILTASIDNADGNFLIGHLGSNVFPFLGNIYKIAVYDRALNAAEVRAVYEATSIALGF